MTKPKGEDMTPSTENRIARIYTRVVGYNPALEGWTMAEALETLRWMRCALILSPDDPSAYGGPTWTSAELKGGAA